MSPPKAAKASVREKKLAKLDECGRQSKTVFDKLGLSNRQKSNRIKKLKLARKTLRSHQNKYLDRKGVVGMGVGFRHNDKKGELQDEVVIRIYVEKKIDDDFLEDYQKLPKVIGGKHKFPVDIIPIGKVTKTAAVDGGAKIRPTHGLKKPGTLGAKTFRKKGFVKTAYALSNSHVVFGDEVNNRPPANSVVQVKNRGRWKKLGECSLKNDQVFENADAAFIKLDDESSLSTKIPEITDAIGDNELDNIGVEFEGHDVVKYGFASDLTEGEIWDCEGVIIIDGVTYRNQIIVTGKDFQLGGDSGSILFLKIEGPSGRFSYTAIGLLHASVNEGDIGLAYATKFGAIREDISFKFS